MKRTGLGIAGLAAAICCGILLPQVSARLQDGYYDRWVSIHNTEPVYLEHFSAWNFLDRLEHSGVSMIQAELRENKRMSRTEAQAATEEILRVLEDSGLLEHQNWTCDSVVPYLAAVRDETEGEVLFQSFNTWRCIYMDSVGNEIGLLLDDDTGKLLAASYVQQEKAAPTVVEASELTERWAAFCESYYGLSLERTEDNGVGRVLGYWSAENGQKIVLNFSISEDGFQIQQ